MPYIQPILEKYDNWILFQQISEPYLASHSTILLADDMVRLSRQPHSDFIVLICGCGFLKQHQMHFPPFEHLTLIIAGCKAEPSPPPSIKAENLVFATCPPNELYAHFLSCFHHYHVWRSKLNAAFTYAESDTVLPALSNTAACAVYVYSAQELILMDCSVNACDTEFTRALSAARFMPPGVRGRIEKSRRKLPLFGKFENGLSFIVHAMKDLKDYRILVLLVYENRLSIDIPINDFLYIISGQWEKHLNFQLCFRHILPPSPCDRLISDLFRNQITDSYLIDDALHQLQFPVDRVISFLYITFPKQKNIALHYSIYKDELQQMYPDCNIGYYENAFIVMFTSQDTVSHALIHPESRPELVKWLKKNQAYAAQSAPTHYWEKLHTLLAVTQKLCQLGQRLGLEPELNFFSSSRYSYYSAIDFCAKSFQELLGHDDLVYLTHPSIISIAKYDKENGTRFRDVLYSYLLCSCNINKTAEHLYMHRNTVRNQVNRISLLFDLDLEDDFLRSNLLFSYQIIHYYEKVLGHDLVV